MKNITKSLTTLNSRLIESKKTIEPPKEPIVKRDPDPEPEKKEEKEVPIVVVEPPVKKSFISRSARTAGYF